MARNRKCKLSTYNAKRDFSRTAEPRGTLAPTSEQLRFVIQKHNARRLHYDLRLELDGVFKSWAVTRGPSRDPSQKRLAVEVEDHPLDYGDFEGTIPAGEYGGGTVMVWDRGTYTAEHARAGLAKGNLKFSLHGAKLNGEWALVRMKPRAGERGRVNWLLIKHRDAFARRGSEKDDDAVSVASGRTMPAIATGQRAEVEAFMTAAAEAIPAKGKRRVATAAQRRREASSRRALPAKFESMPRFIEPQLCKLVDRPPQGDGWVHEIKFDGYRVQVRVARGGAKVLTRSGLDWTDRFGAIARAAARLDECMLDGEIVALDHRGTPDFASLQAAISENATDALVLFAFDLLFSRGEDLRSQPLAARKQALRRLIGANSKPGTIRYVEHFESSADALLESACQLSLEGIVSKMENAPYRSGRGEAWTKAKCRAGHEVVIGGWLSRAGRLRSLMAGVHRGDALIYVGNIGTGFGEAALKKLMPRLRAMSANENPFGGPTAPDGGREVHWLRPELVAEIEYAGWTGEGRIRQGSFKGLREDKDAGDVVAEKPARTKPIRTPNGKAKAKTRLTVEAKSRPESKPSAQSARRRLPAQTGPLFVSGVAISNADKPLWPATDDQAALTKADLANYFDIVADWLMPYVGGRPCSIVRAPDGIAGQHFFQRHGIKGTSSLLTLVKVRGDKQPYLQIDRPEGLIAVAQLAGVELHPWNCMPGDPEFPGRLVFDLDPAPDVSFARVAAAAHEVKERLEALGLNAFCKTTGGKGLHVVVPFAVGRGKTQPGWPEAKAFAKAICDQMTRDTPDRYIATMAKKKRSGRIFLDYLRNDRTATAVALLSPRLRPRAPVSMPVGWPAVNARLDPLHFTLQTVPALIRRSKAWAEYDRAGASLRTAIDRLSG